MIDRVLDRGWLLGEAERIRSQLADELELETEEPDVADAHAAMLAAINGEPVVDDLRPEVRKAFIPRDPVLSLLQSSIEERLRAEHPELLQDAPGATEAGGPAATAVVTSPELEETAGDFTKLDPNWAKEIAKGIVEKLRRGVHELRDHERPPDHPLATDVRVVLVGDWGTGAEAARKVSGHIHDELEEAGDRETHVVHLGDVYYSGQEWEARERFLAHWPVHPDEADRHRSWCLAGNHDLYSGGWGYFDVILGDERFRHQRADDGGGTSFFRLLNGDWQILGLDSSWSGSMLETGHHGHLAGRQAKWIADCMDEKPGRRTMLLSHHQPLSNHGKVSGDLAERMAQLMTRRLVDAWFWGHEHRCMTFAPRPGLAYSACVGHGAMPEPVGTPKPDPGEWEHDDFMTDIDGDRWRLCGFAVLDFAGRALKVRYINERGVCHAEDEVAS